MLRRFLAATAETLMRTLGALAHALIQTFRAFAAVQMLRVPCSQKLSTQPFMLSLYCKAILHQGFNVYVCVECDATV